MERVVELAQLVEGYELEPSEVDLKSISKELPGCKGKVQSFIRSYLVSDDPSLSVDTHELLTKVNEVTSFGSEAQSEAAQETRRATRGLGDQQSGEQGCQA